MERKCQCPIELDIQILGQLRVKSLLRFKSVCKDWNTLIKSSQFINYHTYTSKSNDNGNFFCYREDPDTRKHAISLINEIGEKIADTDWPPFLEEEVENKETFHKGIVVLGPVNGIYCIYNRLVERWCGTLVLWNPATKEYKHILPPISFPFVSNLIGGKWNSYWNAFAVKTPMGLDIGFDFDKNTNDFKLVVITHWDQDYGPTDYRWHVRVYNLSNDSWTTILYLSSYNDEVSPFPELIPPFPHIQSNPEFTQCLLDNVCHWSCYCMLPSEDDEYEGIVMFDMVHESFRLMKGPPYPLSEYNCRSVWAVKDTIVMVVSSSDFWGNPRGTVGVWMMMEYGVQDSWSMVCSFGPIVGLSFVGIVNDDRVFFHDDKDQLISSSMKDYKEFKEYGVFGLRKSLDSGINESFGVVRYVETLVPLKIKP